MAHKTNNGKIIILHRNDLLEIYKNLPLKDIKTTMFNSNVQYREILDAELVVFDCDETNDVKILKNRFRKL